MDCPLPQYCGLGEIQRIIYFCNIKYGVDVMQISACIDYLDDLLAVDSFKDFCPNGLQVEGKRELKVLVTGVTACAALIEKAIDLKADALMVHHGYFWKDEDRRVVGMMRHRLQLLLQHDINLLAYHIPLDAHPTLGNNAQLADRLDVNVLSQFEIGPGWLIGFLGEVAGGISLDDFAGRVDVALNRKPLVIAAAQKGVDTLRKIAWCTGGAQDAIEAAYEQGADVFLTGEVSERTVHFAREVGIHFIAAGHHATERYGVKALGEHLAEQFGLSHTFIDIDNPV